MCAYFTIAKDAEVLVKAFAHNKCLLDLGGLDGTLGLKLLSLGATKVTSFDKECVEEFSTKKVHPFLEFKSGYFNELSQEYTSKFDGFSLSWPANASSLDIIPRILPSKGQLLYIGHNFDGTACGSNGLWSWLTSKHIVAHHSAISNTIILYDLARSRSAEQGLLCEEYAALNQSEVYDYCEGFMHSKKL
jgi:hypothetical protein